MSDTFLIIMPTRGRPVQMLEAIASIIKTADHPENVRITIVVDRDDNDFVAVNGERISTTAMERAGFGAALNMIFQRHVTKENWITWMADDIRYCTQGWDTIVSSHNKSIVYGRDGYQDEKLATHPFIRTELPNALGFLYPPALRHYCGDVFWTALGRKLDCIRFDKQIYTKHLHPDCGFGTVDGTYIEAKEYWEKDHLAYQTYYQSMIPFYAGQVREALDKLKEVGDTPHTV